MTPVLQGPGWIPSSAEAAVRQWWTHTPGWQVPVTPQSIQIEIPGEYGLYAEGRLARAAYAWHEQASRSSKAKVEAFTTIPPSRWTAAAGQSHYSSLAVLVSIPDPASAAGGNSAQCSASRCRAHLLPQIYCSSRQSIKACNALDGKSPLSIPPTLPAREILGDLLLQ